MFIEKWFAIAILCEVLFTLFIVWGFMHEEKFVAFEDAVIKGIKKRIEKKKSDREFM